MPWLLPSLLALTALALLLALVLVRRRRRRPSRRQPAIGSMRETLARRVRDGKDLSL
jgi:hypothetical protein